MIPEESIGQSPVAKALYQSLYNQLGPEYRIIQHIKQPQLDQQNINNLEGCLFWIQYKRQSLFLYLSDTPADFFGTLDKNNHKAIKNRLLNNPEFMALTRFQNRLLPPQLQAHKAELTPFVMIFSNIENDKLNIGIKSLGITLFGKEKLTGTSLKTLIRNSIGEPLSENSHHSLRCVFSPELAMYSHQVDNCLLDSEQEVALKFGMLKPSNTKRYPHLNLRGVNGGINSGKSEVVIQRAKLIYQSSHKSKREDNPKVLILTPNNASQLSLYKRYYTLNPTDKQTEILTFEQWCEQLLQPKKALVETHQVSTLMNQLLQHQLKENDIGITICLQEIEFILGRTIFNEEAYLNANRPTPTHELSKNQHNAIWKALQTIKNELRLADSILFAELPQLLWESINSETIEATQIHYDHILIDDAHLFPPIAFDLVKKLLKPKSGQLFIAQDPNQLLVNSCILWKDTGLDLRGHSTRLMQHYQINPYILNAASSFYLRRLPDNLNKVIHRNLPDVSNNPIPQLLHFHSSKDEQNRLLNNVKKLVHNGTPLKDILLIAIDKKSIRAYKEMISQTLDVPVEVIKGSDKRSKGIAICSLLHAHGQKTAHVFIIDLQHIYETEMKHSEDSDEYQALLIENTNRLTMAMTCAQKELTLFITCERIPSDFINPHIEIPSAKTGDSAEIHSLYA